MRNSVTCFLAATLLSVTAASAQDAGSLTLEKAATDHSVTIPAEKLTQHLRDMDARKLSNLKMIDGGKHSVNIRRITSVETPRVLPNTIDVLVILEGGGTLTTGGQIVNGRISGGVSNPLNVGDLVFIPANLPQGVSGVSGTLTWLDIRWDVDWPAGSRLGAGNAPPAAAPTAVPAGGAARGGRAGFPAPLEYAQTDHAVYIPKSKLDAYLKDMDSKNTATLRMIEGGHFNVNIRRIKARSTEIHEITNDAWFVIEGGGTVGTPLKTEKGDIDTGATAPAKLGDIFFIPANLTHGFSTVNGVVAWLNIRWDINWQRN